jgi:hydrogenase nickel incorporation protein HypB
MTSKRVPIVERLLSANDKLAEENRAVIEAAGIFGLNVCASPGAGKTSLILRAIEALAPDLRIGVVEGDTAPVTIDADKVAGAGAPAVQVNTGGSCHLDAVMLGNALRQLPLEEIDLLVVENVGNLICPAAFKLGTHANVLIASAPEGDDKPYKYPKMYLGADALVLNKVDLLPHLRFDLDYFRRGVAMLNSSVAFFPLSCQSGEGFDRFTAWIREQVAAFRSTHGSRTG